MRIFLLLSLLHIAFGETDFKEEENVIVLTKDNFKAVLLKYDYVLVEFYAPWCGHCKALKPEYDLAAAMIKTEFEQGNVKLAKVDATIETELASEHSVSGYPTVKLHKNGKWFDFTGDRKAQSIVDWLKKKTLPALRLITTNEQLEAFKQSSDVAVVGFIKEGHAAQQILEGVADEMDKHSFAFVTTPELFGKHGITKDAAVLIFKKFDDERVEHEGDFTVVALTEFVTKESIPLVVEFSQESAGNVFGSPVRMHLVAFAPKSGDYEKIKGMMTSVARKFKGKAHFIVIDTDLEDHQRILEFFGMTKQDIPSYRMINLAEDMVKYKPDTSEFIEASMADFVEEVITNKRKPFLISQDIPADDSEPVRVLVGKNYNEVTQDESKAVFAELYAPWCGHCQQLAPIWTQLGEHFKGQSDIIIAKMDATANEAENLRVHSFPTLKYYPKGSGEAIDYSGERTLEALKKFIESEGKIVPTEKPAEDENKDEL